MDGTTKIIMQEQIQQLTRRIEALENENRLLKSANTIPLAVDQAFDSRFLLRKNKILYSGIFNTLGGDANETITGLTGVLTSDIAIVVLKTKGATPRTILTAAAVANSIDIVFSGDPSTDHVVSYIVIRQ